MGQHPDDDDDFDHHPVLLDLGGASSDSITPEKSEFETSSYTFAVSATPSMRRLLLFQQVIPPAHFASDDSAPDGEIEITPAPGTPYEEGRVLYSGPEAMRVLGEISAGVYNVLRGSDAPNLYGTRTVEYIEGDEVYDRVPRWRGRRVELWLYQDGEISRRWQGYVKTTRLNDNGTRIVIETDNVWNAAKDTSINRSAPSAGSGSALLSEIGGGLKFRLGQDLDIENGPGFTSVSSYYIRFGEVLLPSTRAPNLQENNFGGRPLLGSDPSGMGDVGQRIKAEARPIFCISPKADEELGFEASVLPASEAPFGAHPLQIAVFHMTGAVYDADGDWSFPLETGEMVGEGWSAQLRDLFGDDFHSDTFGLIEQSADLAVDHYILGWGAEEVDLATVVQQRLLRPFGYTFGVRQDGRPTIVRFGLPDVIQAVEAETNGRVVDALPSPWVGRYELSLGSSTDVISAVVGRLPWDEGQNIKITARGGDANRSRLGDKGEWTLDYSTISPDRIDEITETLLSRSVLSAFAMPRLKVRAPDASQDGQYDLGELVRLNTLPVNGEYLIDQSGELVEDLTGTRWYGILVERVFDQFRRVYEMTMQLTSYRTGLARLRAPAGVVDAVNEVEPDVYEVRLNDPFGTVGDISDAFVGYADEYRVYFFDENFELTHDHTTAPVPTVLGKVDSSVLVIESSHTPQVGEMVRIATYDDNRARAVVGDDDLVLWNYMSDGTVGELPGGDEEHIYG